MRNPAYRPMPPRHPGLILWTIGKGVQHDHWAMRIALWCSFFGDVLVDAKMFKGQSYFRGIVDMSWCTCLMYFRDVV